MKKLEGFLTVLFVLIIIEGCASWCYQAYNLEPVIAAWLHPAMVAKR